MWGLGAGANAGIRYLNGRTINVKFGWIKNNDGVVRLVTAISAKK